MKDLDNNKDDKLDFEEFLPLVAGLSLACEKCYLLHEQKTKKKWANISENIDAEFFLEKDNFVVQMHFWFTNKYNKTVFGKISAPVCVITKSIS